MSYNARYYDMKQKPANALWYHIVDYSGFFSGKPNVLQADKIQYFVIPILKFIVNSGFFSS